MRAFNKPVKLMALSIGGMFLLSAAFFPLKGADAVNATNPCVQQQLRYGSEGECVYYLQTMLNQGNNAGLATDRDFGPLTKQAVTNWQQKQKATKSDMLVDGVVGSQTWSTLCANYNLFSYAAEQVGCVKPTATPVAAPAPAPSAPSTTLACKYHTFSQNQNSSDECNTYIKSMLNEAVGTSLDGRTFDAKAARLVKFWQAARDIKVDGIVGPETWGSLCTYNDFASTASQTSYTALAKKAGC